MIDKPRLIEHAFPVKQTSLDSVHEKNVRHGHISTLHIWPARRPLAACRAALIATLLPDPGTPEARQELCEKIAGKVVKRVEKKKMPGGQIVEREKEETEGGILHWGRETENAETLEWFRQEIRKAYGGHAPKVLDPFAGGGAIPLEAMRLGCEATAIDINPVAWFILKCTLEYPQKLAGQKRPLPEFILKNRSFMEAFFKAQGLGKAQICQELEKLGHAGERGLPGMDLGRHGTDADLAWHVRAWGQWVLDAARKELARFYPVYADFEPLEKDKKSYEQQPMRLVPLKDDGTPDIEGMNSEFSPDYLAIKSNPRWVAKPTVAYLWARTVGCKNCRAIIPLLKTRWVCKRDQKRVLLTLEPNSVGKHVQLGVDSNVALTGGNAAQRREHDKRVGAGTMTRAGAKCPCCGTISTTEDIRLEGRAHRLGATLVAVVTAGHRTKHYRSPTDLERQVSNIGTDAVHAAFSNLPYGELNEPIPEGASRSTGGSPFTVYRYGLTCWGSLFSDRQLICLGTFLRLTRSLQSCVEKRGYGVGWSEALSAYLMAVLDFVINRNSAVCTWTVSRETTRSTFARFALPITWDFAEAAMLEDASGGYVGAIDWIARYVEHAMLAIGTAPESKVECRSATKPLTSSYDLVVTDPPYYDAIPYSDLMDFFYVWIRRALVGQPGPWAVPFGPSLGPKWDHHKCDGELIDDPSRHDGSLAESKKAYEEGMSQAFRACFDALNATGRLVIVFAHKQPDAWETLVTAMIRAGFVVDCSWPIETEMGNRTRALVGAALASSVWLVCRKRSATAPPGWDNKVLDEMRMNISRRLREFWDAGIRGPDFVWAATGPALESYSKHPVVKMANAPNSNLSVTEFLNHARRMVVDFVVGRVLSRADTENFRESDGVDEAAVDRLDETTAYYLLHRNDFGLDDAPVGACILYATACGLSDQELVRDWDLLARKADDDTTSADDDTDGDDEPVEETASGSRVKLKAWNQRRARMLGLEAPGGRPIPLIDRIHRLMHLWKGGDVHKVDEYLDEHGLRRHELFRRVLQSLIELAKAGGEERSLLESLSNHIGAKGAKKKEPQRALAYGEDE